MVSLSQVLSQADNKTTIMEVIDPEVSVTCLDISHVKKVMQLGLLCTKRHPSERPTMHEVARVLVSLLPAAPATKLLLPSVPVKNIEYARFLVDNKVAQQQQQMVMKHNSPMNHDQDNSSSDDVQWFLKFGEVISKNTLS